MEKWKLNPDNSRIPAANYKIVRGDTLSTIAKRAGTTVDNLMRLNPKIKNKNLIYTNDTLKIKEVKPISNYKIDSGILKPPVKTNISTSKSTTSKTNKSVGSSAEAKRNIAAGKKANGSLKK